MKRERPLSGISSQWHHEPRYYAFPRSSGLPHGTFRDPPRLRMRWVVLALALALLGLAVTALPEGDEVISARLHQVTR